MKNVLLIIACLMAFGANAQWVDVKDDAYYKAKQKVYDDSIEEATKYIITDEDRRLAAQFEGSVDGGKYQGRAYKAEMKIRRIEAAEKSRIQDSIYQRRQKETEIADRKERVQKLKELSRKYGAANGKLLLAGQVKIGMSDKMVDDAFGPAEVKRMATANGITETWYYLGENSHCFGDCTVLDYYMVFKNHKLIAVGDL